MKIRSYLLAALAAALLALAAVLTAPAGSAASSVYYVSPSGSDSAAGTQSAPWRSIAHAQSVVRAGDTVYFRGGTYAYSDGLSNCASQTDRIDGIRLDKSGSSGSPITYAAYPGETPVFDFSGMRDDCRIMGFEVTASWLHLDGLEVTGVRQNNNKNHESWGLYITGGNNVFERLNIHHIQGTGLFISGGSGELVLNSDSHDNYDVNSSNGAGENSDGFGSHYATAGSAQNVFRGCRAWWNGDDGFDLIHTYAPVLIEHSWAWRNGYVPGTTNSSGGNGNGFKAGGYGGGWDSGGVKHTVRFSVAFNNRASGFYANHHTVANDFFNNTGYNNHPDFNMLGVNSSGNAIGIGKLRNNIAYGGTLLSNMSGTDSAYNSWDLGISLSDSQFQSVSTSGWDAPRKSDGSLPELAALHLAAGSAMIDRGTNVGLPYNGGAPDLGAFETGGGDDGGGDTVRYEAEDAPATCDGTIDTNHSGYSGSGFCNTPNTTGSASQFTVTAASGGSATVLVRYANGSSARGANVVVNGSTVGSVSFSGTGSWDTWASQSITVPLNAGSNTIRLTATGADGLPNIDYLEL